MTPDEIRQVLSTAVLAPSVHNTQPWLFEADGDVLDVRADRSRQLTVQDPQGRELLLSCGAAALHAWLAVRGLGRACTLQWLPVPDDPDHVARLTAGDPEPPGEQEARLLEAVPLRHTDRSAFAEEPVPDELVDAMRAAAEREGAWLAAEQRPDQVSDLEALVWRADQALRRDPQVQEEQRGWVRGGTRPAEGLPSGALPGHGHDRGSSLTLRDFEPADPAGPPQEPPPAEHPLLLVLGTPAESREDWVRGGAALARLLLTATAEGLVANPQTQVMEVPVLRARLRSQLGFVGEPQVLLRVGRPTGPGSPQAGRRSVDEVLRPSRSAGPTS